VVHTAVTFRNSRRAMKPCSHRRTKALLKSGLFRANTTCTRWLRGAAAYLQRMKLSFGVTVSRKEGGLLQSG
jgi:hypothetical protein